MHDGVKVRCTSGGYHRVVMTSLRLASVFFTFALALTGTARAEHRCRVGVDGSATSAHADAWRGAATSVGRKIEASGRNDCDAILVTPDAEGAVVAFTTHDGRTAVRRIKSPDELLPLADALLVAFPDGEPDARVDASFAPAPLPPPASMMALQLENPAAREPVPGQEPAANAAAKRDHDARARVVVGAAGGVKGGARGDGAAALGRVLVGVSNGHWEALAFGRWDVEHTMTAAARTGDRVSIASMGAGVLGGRRQPIGSLVLVLGSGVGVYSVDQELHVEPGSLSPKRVVHETFAEPRVDAYFGLIVPASSRLRFRMQLEGQLALLAHASRADFPAAPRWTTGITLGAEAAFLP